MPRDELTPPVTPGLDILAEMDAWRSAHPTATLAEIEAALDERLSALRREMVTDSVAKSPQADWSARACAQRPLCPTCGVALQPRGKRTRKLRSAGGDITLDRTYADGSLLVQTTQLSSFSRLAEAETVTHLATVATSARGVELAGKIVAVSDGADWLQKLVELHCPQAERLLDFPHAAQRLSHIATLVFGEGTLEARSWYETQRRALKQSGAQAVLAVVEELCAT